MAAAEIDLENPVGLGCALESFMEAEEVEGMIKTLSRGETNEVILENLVQRFVTIVDYYQEQPHLLDRNIPGFFRSLLSIGVNADAPAVSRNHAFRFMYYLTKTRGYKNILKLLPHEVSDLPLALSVLTQQDINDRENWESRYMLFIWLSVIVLIPFEMSRFDGSSKVPIAQQLMDIGLSYLSVSDSTRDAAAFFLSKFTTRPDIVKKYMQQFLDQVMQGLEAEREKVIQNTFYIISVLRCLTLIFKHGKRDELLEYASNLYPRVQKFDLENDQNVLYRKCCCKLYHRLALVHLKTKIASWKYKKGARSLNVNSVNGTSDGHKILSSGDGFGVKEELSTGEEIDVEGEEEVAEDVEMVLNDLLNGFIRDPDTLVRWSAAKSIGRITARLPLDLANEIIDTLLSNFNALESEHTWHGSCLSLAELARRGLILPERLPDLMPVVEKSLQFEEQRGFSSVGSSVRDAACFVAWSLPRTFSKAVMLPYVERIASQLVLAVLFDRQVNCRRAASAAFQENVGRHGKLPYGIEVLTLADYSAVGRSSDCYTKLAVEIAKFENYQKSIIDHIAQVRVAHWDESIRILASEALGLLCEVNAKYISDEILPNLIKNMIRTELNVRYGSIKSTSCVILSLHKLGCSAKALVSDEMKPVLRNLVPDLENNNYLKGLGGETIKPIVCEFIAKVSQTDLYDSTDLELRELLLSFLISCVKNKKEEIQIAGAEAMLPFVKLFSSDHDPSLRTQVVNILMEGLDKNDGIERAGFTLLVGHLPSYVYTQEFLSKVIDNLLNLLISTMHNAAFAQSRVNALKSLAVIYEVKSEQNDTSTVQLIMSKIFESIHAGLRDHSINERGDIGAKTRKAAMQCFAKLLAETAKRDNQSLLPNDLMNQCLCLIMMHLSSRIDAVREECFVCLTSLYKHKLIRLFKEGTKLEQLVGEFAALDESERDNYCSIKMLRFVYPMLHLDTYTYYILVGLTSCIGGMTESFCAETLTAFNSYVQMISEDPNKCSLFLDAYLQVFRDNRGIDRIISPFLEGTTLLLQAGIFDAVRAEDTDFGERLVGFLEVEAKNCPAYHKLVLLVNLFSALLLSSNSKVHQSCLKQMLVFLGHRFPRLRKHTASQLFENILICPELTMNLPEEAQESIQNLLSDFDWINADLIGARDARNTISVLLGLPVPKKLTKLTNNSNSGNAVEEKDA